MYVYFYKTQYIFFSFVICKFINKSYTCRPTTKNVAKLANEIFIVWIKLYRILRYFLK